MPYVTGLSFRPQGAQALKGNGNGLIGHHGRTLFSFALMLSHLFLLLSVVFHVTALRFPVNGKFTSPTPRVDKRGHISGLDDAQNLKYFTNITLGGQSFSVQIDTGRQALNTPFFLC